MIDICEITSQSNIVFTGQIVFTDFENLYFRIRYNKMHIIYQLQFTTATTNTPNNTIGAVHK
jgi:hypothetical protein